MYGRWDFHELYALPVKLRDWFAERLTSHLQEQVDIQAKNN